MGTRRPLGTSPLERLGRRLDADERTCPACGHVDTECRWETRAVDGRIVYRHECRCCGLSVTRSVRFGGTQRSDRALGNG